MKKLEYTATIAANRQKVWDTMLQPDTYKIWANATTPQYNSYYEGIWAQGENISFVAPGMGGTMATITEYRPNEYVHMRHIATIHPDGSAKNDPKDTTGWVGTTESYRLTENNGNTELKVVIESSENWESMFNEWWPGSIAKLKALCEG